MTPDDIDAAESAVGDGRAAHVQRDDALAERAKRWAATMRGHQGDGLAVAHQDSSACVGDTTIRSRIQREAADAETLASAATLADGAGHRRVAEDADRYRTCFERDRDRIYHATAFRRLAGKTQVFIFPEDHQRNRLTHALEVAQVARSVSTALGLNVALTEAIAIGHDCGHGPGGHASEDALSPYLSDGFDHAVWGADVTLEPLNLCRETLDGIRNHSWSRPAPSTPEGEVVSWADRIAYVCHDFEDAAATGVVSPTQLPGIVVERVGTTRSQQLGGFIQAMVDAAANTGRIGMTEPVAEALAAFRRFNYDNIYLRAESRSQGQQVVELLRALVDHFIAYPDDLAASRTRHDNRSDQSSMHPSAGAVGSDVFAAVDYVAGMTDRFACRQAVERLGWPIERLPTTMTHQG